MTIIIAAESPDQPEVAAFLAAADAYSKSLYPPESNHLVGLGVLVAPNARFFVARQNGRAVGCGAVILQTESSAEIKRMWVAPEVRGQGVGRKVLDAIETTARAHGIGVLQLETGIHNTAALGLYRACGFRHRAPFGRYEPDPLSLFMEKQLV